MKSSILPSGTKIRYLRPRNQIRFKNQMFLMTVGLLKEPAYETRVSLLAESVAALTKKGIRVLVEAGAGEKAFCHDEEYISAGAGIAGRNEIIQSAEIILSIHLPLQEELNQLNQKVMGMGLIEFTTLVCLFSGMFFGFVFWEPGDGIGELLFITLTGVVAFAVYWAMNLLTLKWLEKYRN